MTAFEPIILALPLEETCDEITRAMQIEGFTPKTRHRLDPKELGLSESKRKRHLTVIMDFGPPGLPDEESGFDPLLAELYVCQVVCEAADPHYTRVTFIEYEQTPGLEEDIPPDLAVVTQRRLMRVHASLNRRV